MFRDWYIRTDQRHIQDTFGDINATPLTFREKWQKNRTKYIFRLLAVAVLIGVLLVVLPDVLPRDIADYTVTLVSGAPMPEKAQHALADALAACGSDRNGDGKVQVQIRTIAVGDDMHNAHAERERLITSFFSNEYTFFAMEKTCYERYVLPYTADGETLFVSPDGNDVVWEATALPAELTAALSDTLVCGVRAVPNASEKERLVQAAHLALLRTYMARS